MPIATLATAIAIALPAVPEARAADFAPAVNHPGPQFPFGVAVGDLDGNRRPDVVTADVGGNDVAVPAGRGDGTLGPPVHLPPRVQYGSSSPRAGLNVRFSG